MQRIAGCSRCRISSCTILLRLRAQGFRRIKRRARTSLANEVQYPADHKLGIRVPKGGSDCEKCEYLGKDDVTCKNSIFVKWNGSKFLPAPKDEYCCDLFEANKPKPNGSFFGEKR